jgi:squalene-hopene/tetraprenyl-beta-curcumene cyclase
MANLFRMKPRSRWAVAACLGASLGALGFSAGVDQPPAWNRQAAASYLDGRQTWWVNWPESARDHQTFCVSCHTVIPYALARPALRSLLGEAAPSANDTKLLENVTRRVTLWSEMQPFYSDEKVGAHKTGQSRGTESILNALILASFEAQNSGPTHTLATAFRNMWAEQQQTGDKKGSWLWLNFHTQPWEADDSPYYGATLAAVAVGTAPGDYRSSPEIRANLQALREYLLTGYEKQPLNNRIFLLWASSKLPGLLRPDQRQAIMNDVFALQQQDGGWSLSALVGPWKRGDGTPLETKSDGYATGVICFAMQQAGVSPTDARVKEGLAWLVNHQDKSRGLWPAYSLNKQRNPSADAWLFMSDAATGYSVLALTLRDIASAAPGNVREASRIRRANRDH